MQDYFINNMHVSSTPVIEKPKENKIVSIENILQEIIYPLQSIEVSAKALSNPLEPELQLSASKLITSNINQIKNIIGINTYNNEIEEEENFIPFELQNIPVKDDISENISIGIYGKKTTNNERLNMILQTSGFFVRITDNSQEMLSFIEENLIHMLIISPESEQDECFTLCNVIRQKYSLIDLPILVLVNKYRSHLIEESFNAQINDFLIRPFDVSALLARIQILINYQNLYNEKQELLKSEKEKRTFLYFVTHNVNTPLTVLLNEMQTLSELSQKIAQEQTDSPLPEVVKNIQESTNQINILIQNVLNSYKLSDGRFLINPTIIDLEEYLTIENKYLTAKAEFKKQSFIFECLSKSPRVFCDINSLKGIYTNLVDNAIKYTPFEGHIKIQITNDKAYVYLKIIDDGQGIPKEKQIVLFDRFANIGSKPTWTEKSVGLGLYVVNEICKLNELTLDYTENTDAPSGSIFTIRFPRIS
ncbi:MAG: hybrid sensor histidine kinase/response regulator [Treponema sp.]|nr:hybrid sensor histidine kinase/response regulator [Treponema sp.]